MQSKPKNTDHSPRSLWSRIFEPQAKFDFICSLPLENCVERLRACVSEQNARRNNWIALISTGVSEVGFSHHNSNLYDFWITRTSRGRDGSYLVLITDGYLVRAGDNSTRIWGYFDIPSIIMVFPIAIFITVGGFVLQHPEVIVIDVFLFVLLFGWQWVSKAQSLSIVIEIFNCDEKRKR